MKKRTRRLLPGQSPFFAEPPLFPSLTAYLATLKTEGCYHFIGATLADERMVTLNQSSKYPGCWDFDVIDTTVWVSHSFKRPVRAEAVDLALQILGVTEAITWRHREGQSLTCFRTPALKAAR